MSELQIESVAPQPAARVAARSSTSDRTKLWLGLLLLGTLLKGVGWVFLIYPLDAPDEPSHFNHILQIRTNHALPAIVMGAPNFMRVPPSTPQDPVTRAFLEHYGFNAFRAMPYESSQPPLYYVTAAIFLAPVGEDRLALMYAARLVSVLFGVGAVLALWLGVRLLWPDNPFLQWVAPVALTLAPEFTFVTSSITNDAAVLFFGAALLTVWAGGLRAALDGSELSLWKWGLLAGVVTALGLLSKLTMAVTVPGTALWLWWLAGAAGREAPVARRLRAFLVGGVASAAMVIVGIGWWVARNLSIYGELTGSSSVFSIYHKIYWTRRGFPLNQLFSFFPLTPFGDPRGGFVILTFITYWAAFGWDAVFLSPWSYVAIALLSLAGVVGLARVWRVGLRKPLLAPAIAHRRLGWLSLIALGGAFIILLAYNSLVDYQPQGRYLFVVFAPMILLLVAGLRKATSRPQINNALLWCLLGLFAVMQILSVLALMDQYAHIFSLG